MTLPVMRIRDVVSPTLCVRYDEPAGLILDRMRTTGVHHVIITRQRDIIGVASESDVALTCADSPDNPVGNIATEVPILDSDALVKEAAILMRSRQVGCVPVVDNDVIAGIVTVDTLLELIGDGAIHESTKRRRRHV